MWQTSAAIFRASCYHGYKPLNTTWSFPESNLHVSTFPHLSTDSLANSDTWIVCCFLMVLTAALWIRNSGLRVDPLQGNTPVFRYTLQTPPINHQDYSSLPKPVWLSTQRGETSLADQVSSCPPTCHTPLSPQRSGVELHPLRHIALCLLFKLFIKESGRQDETATHNGFVMLLVSPCIFPSAKRSFRARFVTW